MRRRPTGGRGSNQYATKGTPTDRRGRQDTGALSGALTDELDSEQVAWMFHPDRSAWEQQDMGAWVDARPWVEAGFTAADAGWWRNWPNLKTFEEAVAWRNLGVTDRRELANWMAVPFTATEAEPWIRSGFSQNEMARWLQAGFTVTDAVAWGPVTHHSSYVSARQSDQVTAEEDLALWAQTSIPPAEWRSWTHGMMTADQAELWHRQGFDEWAAFSWKSEFTDPAEAAEWRDHGLDPAAAGRWKRAGTSPPEAAELNETTAS